MNKVRTATAAVTSTALYLLTSATVFAQNPLNVTLGNTPPTDGAGNPIGISPAQSIAQLIRNVLTIAYIAGALAVLIMLVWGAFSWITSGGDKDAVGKAQKRIQAALVGLVILALAFLITVIIGLILNINILNLGNIPTLNRGAPGF